MLKSSLRISSAVSGGNTAAGVPNARRRECFTCPPSGRRPLPPPMLPRRVATGPSPFAQRSRGRLRSRFLAALVAGYDIPHPSTVLNCTAASASDESLFPRGGFVDHALGQSRKASVKHASAIKLHMAEEIHHGRIRSTDIDHTDEIRDVRTRQR